MPETDYDSAKNIHICRNGAPGMSAAYEDQTLLVLTLKRLVKHFTRECNLVPELTSLSLGQYGKVSVGDFPVQTSLSVNKQFILPHLTYCLLVRHF